MISRAFVLNVFCSVDKVSLVMINCMRFVFVLISVTSMKDIFDTIFTVKDAESNGISRQRLSLLVKEGRIERVERGIYAPVGDSLSGSMEIAILARRGTDFVLTLESALRVHNLTTATPHAVWIAMKRGARSPSVAFPLEIVRVNDQAFRYGAEEHIIDGVKVLVYSAAKTVADLFKFRNRVGLDVAIAALNLIIDFDFVEKGAQRMYPKKYEWYGAFGLMVTLVWLYVEILRLLAKVNSRD